MISNENTNEISKNMIQLEAPLIENTNSNETNNLEIEVKEQEKKPDLDEPTFKEYEDAIYNIEFKQSIMLPKSTAPYIDEKIECFVVRFEKYDNIIAAGYSNGSIGIYNLENGTFKTMKASEYPVTSIRWKPHNESKPKNILVSVTADGKITHWHTATGKPLHQMEEKDNPIMCMDYSSDGMYFATAGNDKVVKIYDDNTKTLLKTMKQTSFNFPGHSNRIFCVTFNKENPNLLCSGGWDNTIQFYDLREGAIVNHLFGPHICGDSIDIKGNNLLTGSWSIKNQLQLWDIRNFKLSKNLLWDTDQLFCPTYIYTAQFSKNPNVTNLFAVGGSNENTLRIFEDETENRRPQISSNFMSTSCYSIDFSNRGHMMAYGCGDGNIRIFSLKKKLKIK